MAYNINRYNGALLVAVVDGTLNTSATSLGLVGKNYAGYGEIQNENFVHLLENFSNVSPPTSPLSGQLWYDSVNKKLKFYTGTQWKTTGGSEISLTQPSGLSEGDFWWDSNNQQLYVFNGITFVLVGPARAGSGITEMVSKEIFDISDNLKSIILATVEDNIVAVISPETFTAKNPSVDLPGFNGYLKRGITLVGTNSNGIADSSLEDQPRFWGKASDSDRLGGKLPSEFVTQDQIADTNYQDGITIKDDFRIYIDTLSRAVLEHRNKASSKIIFTTTNSSNALVTPVIVDQVGLTPGINNEYDLGTTTFKWKNVHATEFKGLATSALSLRVGSSDLIGATTETANTVAARDADGNLRANLFVGIATSARYADLAEKYTTDKEYPVGTLLSICEHGDHELEAATKSSVVIGTISENPAYLMNAEADGQAVALKGRVPVRVVGSVKKGQPIYAWNNGTASTVPTGSIVAVALETNMQVEEKLVECVLKV